MFGFSLLEEPHYLNGKTFTQFKFLLNGTPSCSVTFTVLVGENYVLTDLVYLVLFILIGHNYRNFALV